MQKKIFLVEDSELTVKFMADFLHENGYKTEVTARGEDAVREIRNGLSVDLILMDIGLEGKMDGIEATRRILEIRDIPVVFITANTSKEIIRKIKEVRAYGFVLKGIEKAAILSTIEMALKLHEANAQIRMKEAMLSAIMDATEDSIILFNEKREITFCNLAGQNFFGYSQDEILGKNLCKLVASYKFGYIPYQHSFANFQITEKSNFIGKNIEFIVLHKDGHEMNVEVSLSELRFNGTWYGVGVVRDIGIRKKQEEKLKKSREEYLELSENAPVGVLKCDLQANFTYVNQKVLEIVGAPCIEEIKKINLYTFLDTIKTDWSKNIQKLLKNNQAGIEEVNYQTAWGKTVWLRAHMKPLGDLNKVTGMQIIIDEITEKKKLEEKLLHLSVTDELTGVYNRRYMKKKLQEEIEKSQRSGKAFSIIMFDIDHFKKVNDAYGHNVGDLILETIAIEIKNRIGVGDVLARWGGEEFIILFPDRVVENTISLAEELRKQLCQRHMPWVGSVSASFGLAGYLPKDSIDVLVKRADTMMYIAKRDGRNCVRYEKSYE